MVVSDVGNGAVSTRPLVLTLRWFVFAQALTTALKVRNQPRAYRRFLDQTRDYLLKQNAAAAQNPERAAWHKTLSAMQASIDKVA